ncbi:MAG: SEL1-like repeat protein [Chloroflexi bacterium]|nr:SEL1-like repeat protein [Chloroflexota bacterium]
MASRKCDRCGSEIDGHNALCPACGAPVPMAEPASSPQEDTHCRKRWLKLIGGTLVAGLAGFLLVAFLSSREEAVSLPKAGPTLDFKATKTKAERGEAQAQNDLANLYARGQGTPQDYAAAAQWYHRAADQGHAAAQNSLAEMYEAGQGVPRSEAEAVQWFRRAAEQGQRNAQYSLAVMLAVGRGGPLDDGEAVKWYRRAADQGDALAQYNLGERCIIGRGVPPDNAEAFKWLSLAATQGIADAAKSLDQLKGKMTREQISEGQRRSAAFTATNSVSSARK